MQGKPQTAHLTANVVIFNMINEVLSFPTCSLLSREHQLKLQNGRDDAFGGSFYLRTDRMSRSPRCHFMYKLSKGYVQTLSLEQRKASNNPKESNE